MLHNVFPTDPVTIPATAVGREYLHRACNSRTFLDAARPAARLWCCYCREYFASTAFCWTDGDYIRVP